MQKKYTALILSLILAGSSLLGGCRPSVPAPGTGDQSSQGQTEDASSDSQGETTDAEGFTHYEGPLTPWNNTDIVGTVTEETNYSPKDDFYAYVNRDWVLANSIPEGYSSYDTLTERQLEVDDQILSLLQNKDLTDHEAVQTRTLYELWLDWDSRNEVGVAPLKEIIDEIRAISSLDQLSAYMADPRVPAISIPLANCSTTPDPDDASVYAVMISPLDLIMEDAGYYQQMGEDDYLYQPVYTDVLAGLLQRCGYTEEESMDVVGDCFHFEQASAAHTMSTADLAASDAIEKINNPRTWDQLEEEQGDFPLTSILKSYGMDGSDRYILMQPEWLAGIDDLYTEENLELIKNYLIVSNCMEYCEYLDREAYDSLQDLYTITMGKEGTIPDETAASQCVSTFLAMPLGQLYARHYVDEKTREEITDIITDIIGEYRIMLQGEDFLSEETRERAVAKLDAMTIRVAAPESESDFSDLTLQTPEEGGTLTGALMAISRKNVEADAERVNQKVDHDEWSSSPQDVNAYYSPDENSITICAGIIGGEVYSSDMPIEEKYANIGVAAAHEITHAFDTDGAQYDETGAIRNWWQEEDFTSFRERADALIRYYDAVVPLEGVPYSGEQVDTEAIADLGAMKCVLALAGKIDGFDYKVFFEKYASLWRRLSTYQTEYYLISQDVHPLAYLRVNVMVQQFQEFYDAYGIEEGDGMYLPPAERLQVW